MDVRLCLTKSGEIFKLLEPFGEAPAAGLDLLPRRDGGTFGGTERNGGIDAPGGIGDVLYVAQTAAALSPVSLLTQ